MTPTDSFDVVCNAIRYMSDGLTNNDILSILKSFDKQGWQLVKKPVKSWLPVNDWGTCWYYGDPDGDIWETQIYSVPDGTWLAQRRHSDFDHETAEFRTMQEAAEWCML